ncbi:lipid/sterol:H+ symporter, putative [Hepatocystis sp. ex Piliocolobus tephrosceles]|nr:lipid/sterol:H+ symporter, putative [Hepatocystis sp. ex Piliocolobus tephrosceles]
MFFKRFISKFKEIKQKSIDNFSLLLYDYAGYVYDRPLKIIFFSLVLCSALTLGFYYKENEIDIYKLYSLSNSYAYETYHTINDIFNITRKTFILIESNINLLQPAIIKELKIFEDGIKNITVDMSEVHLCKHNDDNVPSHSQSKVSKQVFQNFARKIDVNINYDWQPIYKKINLATALEKVVTLSKKKIKLPFNISKLFNEYDEDSDQETDNDSGNNENEDNKDKEGNKGNESNEGNISDNKKSNNEKPNYKEFNHENYVNKTYANEQSISEQSISEQSVNEQSVNEQSISEQAKNEQINKKTWFHRLYKYLQTNLSNLRPLLEKYLSLNEDPSELKKKKKKNKPKLSEYENDEFFPSNYIPPLLITYDRCKLQNVFPKRNIKLNLRDAPDSIKKQITFTLDDICEKRFNECNTHSIFLYYEKNNANFDENIKVDNLEYYVNRRSFKYMMIPGVFGNPKYIKNSSGYIINSTHSLMTTLNISNLYVFEPYAMAYEKKLIDYVRNYNIDYVLNDPKVNLNTFDDVGESLIKNGNYYNGETKEGYGIGKKNDKPFIKFHILAYRSLEDEVDRISQIDFLTRLLFIIGVFLIFIYALFNNVTSVLYRSKPLCAVIGIFCGFFGYLAGSGFLFFLGVKSVPPAETVPFLVIGVGVDDVFVILNSYSLLFMIKDDKKRIQMCMKDSALVITVTTITNIIAFLISSISPFYSICSFSLFTASSLFFGYIMVITLLLSILCIEAKLEKRKKNIFTGFKSLLCCNKRGKTKDKKKNTEDNLSLELQIDPKYMKSSVEYENISIYEWIHNLYLFEESINNKKKKNSAKYIAKDMKENDNNVPSFSLPAVSAKDGVCNYITDTSMRQDGEECDQLAIEDRTVDRSQTEQLTKQSSKEPIEQPSDLEKKKNNFNESSDLKDSGVKDSDVKDSQVKDSQVKDSDLKDSGVKDSQVKDSDVKDSQVKDSQVKDSQVKDSQVKDSQVKDSDVKDPQVKDSDVKDPQVKDSDVKDSDVKDSDVQSKTENTNIKKKTSTEKHVSVNTDEHSKTNEKDNIITEVKNMELESNNSLQNIYSSENDAIRNELVETSTRENIPLYSGDNNVHTNLYENTNKNNNNTNNYNNSTELATKDTMLNNMNVHNNKNIYMLSSHDNVLFYKYIYEEPKGNIGKYFRFLVKNYYVPFLSSKKGKIVVYIIFLITIILSLYGCTKMKKGIKYDKAFPSDSYVRLFFKARLEHYPQLGDMIQVFFFDKDFLKKYQKLKHTDNINTSSILYSDKTDREMMNNPKLNRNIPWHDSNIHNHIINMQKALEKQEFMTMSANGFDYFLKNKANKLKNDETIFYNTLVDWLQNDYIGNLFFNDFIFLNKKLIAWKLSYFQTNIDDSEISSKWLKTCKEIMKIEDYNLQLLCFHTSALFNETDEAIIEVTLKNLGITIVTILIVTAYVIKGYNSCIIIAITIFLIDLCIFGFMCLCGITMNIISMVILVLSVGFSIDHTSHIVQAFTHSMGRTRDEKMKESLHLILGPVLHSGLSTWCVISTLFFSNKDFTVIFFQTLSLVLFFSVALSSVLLPVILSSFGPL